MMNRYACRSAELSIEGLAHATSTAFATTTDLGIGLDQPVPTRSDDGVVQVTVPDCPPRTLLRAYWPLRRAT
jgi:hypothetical protein